MGDGKAITLSSYSCYTNVPHVDQHLFCGVYIEICDLTESEKFNYENGLGRRFALVNELTVDSATLAALDVVPLSCA